MKPDQDMETFLKRGKLHVTTDPSMDARVLDDARAAMQESLAAPGWSLGRPLHRYWAIRLAAAAALVVVTCSLLMLDSRGLRPQPIDSVIGTRPAVHGLSARSLQRAFLHGGMEALDSQAQQAFDDLGYRPARVSLRNFYTGSNGI